MKSLGNNEFISNVFEEIYAINEEKGSIMRYGVIVEQAKKDLMGVIKTWQNDTESSEQLEIYNPLKLGFYFLKTMCAMQLLHE